MSENHTTMMKKFFDFVDRKTEKNPKKLALAFADFYSKNKYTFLDSERDVKSSFSPCKSVSILARDTPLEVLSRRIPLIANTSIFTHYNEERHLFNDSEGGSGSFGQSYTYWKDYIRCPDLIELGSWIKDCKPLLTSGYMFYVPDILSWQLDDDNYCDSQSVREKEISRDYVIDLIVDNRQVVEGLNSKKNDIELFQEKRIKSALVKPVLKIDFPCIEEVSLRTFSKITLDESEALNKFRDFLRCNLLDLRKSESKESYYDEIMKISMNIREGVRSLDSDFKLIQKKSAFQSAGATLASVTAILVAVNSAAFGFLPGLVGAGGGLLALGKTLEEYLAGKHQSIQSPYYYLWLFSKKSHRRI